MLVEATVEIVADSKLDLPGFMKFYLFRGMLVGRDAIGEGPQGIRPAHVTVMSIKGQA